MGEIVTNPLIVEVTRGSIVESRHYGAMAVCDHHGRLVDSLGDVETPIFPRSAVKAMQAILLVQSGAADAFDFTSAQLSLACASHNGEPEHLKAVAAMLAVVGYDEAVLGCGAHWSNHRPTMAAQMKAHSHPTSLMNNCSGKHAGFLANCRHLGFDHNNYLDPDHPVQQAITDTMSEVTGAAYLVDHCGIDGCAAPTFAVPLKNLATAFAKMTTGQGLSTDRARAAKRLLDACMQEPFMMAGSDRFCTRVMQFAPGEIFVKTGAEGVFCAALPKLGLGIALKCDDGATRASEAMMAAVIAKLLPKDHKSQSELTKLARKPIKNWNKTVVGQVRAVLS